MGGRGWLDVCVGRCGWVGVGGWMCVCECAII